MALKAQAGLPLTFAVKDLTLDLRTHIDMVGSVVHIWDTVPAELDAWGPNLGFDDPCAGWTMTPTGCAAATPGRVVGGGRTVLTWTLDMPPDLWNIEADVAQFIQAFTDVALNARQAQGQHPL